MFNINSTKICIFELLIFFFCWNIKGIYLNITISIASNAFYKAIKALHYILKGL